MAEPLVIDERVTIPAADLDWSAVRASGPGGQNVNKVASKVELRFDLAASRALDETTKARLRHLAGAQVDAAGVLLVKSQRTRNQLDNLEDARDKLRDLIRRALVRDKPRRPTRPTRASRARRIADKRLLGEKKRRRRADD